MIGGLVLAAGAGRRFGSTKQLAELDGRPLVQHALDAMAAVPAVERVVVVLGSDADRVREGIELGDAEPVICREWEEGLAASLRTGVAELSDAEAVVVTLGDQPGVTSEVIAASLEERDGEARAVRTLYDGQPGHPVVIERRLFATIATLRGDTGARELLRNVDLKEWEAGHLARPEDVDTPEQLDGLRG